MRTNPRIGYLRDRLPLEEVQETPRVIMVEARPRRSARQCQAVQVIQVRISDQTGRMLAISDWNRELAPRLCSSPIPVQPGHQRCAKLLPSPWMSRRCRRG